MSILIWFLTSTPGRVILGLIAFFVWLQFHDANVRDRLRQELAAEQERLALQRVKTLEKNNADFNRLSDRDRCLVYMRDSSLPEQACDGR